MEARVRCALSAAMRHFCSDASVDATLTIAAKTKLGFRCTYTHAHTHARTHTCTCSSYRAAFAARKRSERLSDSHYSKALSLPPATRSPALSTHSLTLSKGTGNHFYMPVCLSLCVCACKCYGNGQCEWQWECECEREWANKSIRRVAAPTGGSPCDLFHQCVSLAPTGARQATGAAAGWTCD